jgi:uracil-DNA glycosylase
MRIEDRLGESWCKVIPDTSLNLTLQTIADELASEREYYKVLPESGSELTFKAFRMTPFDKVKVVVIGQDIYHKGAFNGVAFGNGFPDNPAEKLQPSLRNIIKEVQRSYPEREIDTSLYSWADQGVLLMNTAHTVRYGDAGSHIHLWEDFTKHILYALSKRNDIVWMLWGAYAHAYEGWVQNDTHHIIKTGHPSPLNRTNPFVGSGCFLECDRILGDNKINW